MTTSPHEQIKLKDNFVDAPLITVGLTCFNAEASIARALRSASSQDWPNTEIIVVDDGSIDGSVELVRSFAETDDRVRLIVHEANQGYPSALNSIIANARGSFVAFFDDDDESRPDRLSLQYRRIVDYETASGASLVACYTSRTVVLADGSRGSVSCIGRREPSPHGVAVADFLLLHEVGVSFVFGAFGSCTLMARRSTFEAVGPFDTEFRRCAEWDWAVRLAFMDGHFIGVDAPLLTQYVTRTTDKAGRLPLHYALLLRRRKKAYLARKRLYNYARVMAHLRFYYAKERTILFRLCLLAGFLLAPRRMWQHVRAYRRVKT